MGKHEDAQREAGPESDGQHQVSFTAAHAIAKAQSPPEALKLHTEFLQKLATQTTEQTKEFFDLSTRATQHVFEQAQAAATKAMKPAA